MCFAAFTLDYFVLFTVQGAPTHAMLGKVRQRNRHVRHVARPLRCGTLIYFKFISNASIMFQTFSSGNPIAARNQRWKRIPRSMILKEIYK